MSKISEILAGKGYKNFMAKLYGIGASIVMIGALFKLEHFSIFTPKDATYMLTLGLIVEAIIFFFSAFEPLHAEPDWSIVYPELWDSLHEGEERPEQPMVSTTRRPTTTTAPSMNQLAEVFEKANINEATLAKLGDGINRLGDTASKLADISQAASVTSEYTKAMEQTAKSAAALDMQLKNAGAMAETNNRLNESMIQYIEKINATAKTQEDLNKQLNEITKRMTATSAVYGNILSAMNIKA
ncbi:MAG: gliding motility protein GldL [Bacteroidales bacterium]|nr:gliding motility protein GldL [Bacteroidales bacterium]